MKKEELQKLVEENTNDGQINYNAIANGINEHANTIRDNYFEKEKVALKGKLVEEVKSEFLKEYGYDNVDQFSSFVENTKATTSEKDEKLKRILKENEAYQTEIEEITGKYNDANKTLKGINNQSLAKKLGVKEDMVDFALFEANKLVTEETNLESVLEGFKEEKANLFVDQEPKERIKVGLQPEGKKDLGGGNLNRWKELKAQGKI